MERRMGSVRAGTSRTEGGQGRAGSAKRALCAEQLWVSTTRVGREAMEEPETKAERAKMGYELFGSDVLV